MRREPLIPQELLKECRFGDEFPVFCYTDDPGLVSRKLLYDKLMSVELGTLEKSTQVVNISQ